MLNSKGDFMSKIKKTKKVKSKSPKFPVWQCTDCGLPVSNHVQIKDVATKYCSHCCGRGLRKSNVVEVGRMYFCRCCLTVAADKTFYTLDKTKDKFCFGKGFLAGIKFLQGLLWL